MRASLGAHGVASVPQCGLQAPDLSVCGARHDAWNHAWTMWFTFKLKVWAPTTARLESNHLIMDMVYWSKTLTVHEGSRPRCGRAL